MSEFDQLYREVILDHYKNPRGHGLIEDADAEAEGQNPLCGDEVSIYVSFAEDGDTIDEVKFIYAGALAVGVYNLGGEYFALEDRCSHDDGPLCEGDFDCDEGIAICPRHGANIDIRSGRALTLPAVQPVDTFPVRVEDGMIKVEVTGGSPAASRP